MQFEEEQVDYDEDSPPSSQEQQAGNTLYQEDVYGDLYNESGEQATLLKAKYAALEDRCKAAEAALSEAESKVQTMIAERESLLEEKKILIRNISCIFRTATEEIHRKDQLIKEKQAEIDNAKQIWQTPPCPQ